MIYRILALFVLVGTTFAQTATPPTAATVEVWAEGKMPGNGANATQAEVPGKQSELVKVGDVVHVQIPALGNKDIEGRIVFVSSTVNPETRTVTARTEVANPDRAIRPAMLATMLIQDRPQQRALLPVEAVIREGNRDYVFMSKGDNQYRLAPVFLGPESNGVRPIVEGLKPGDTVVTEGAFHLNNERKLNLQ